MFKIFYAITIFSLFINLGCSQEQKDKYLILSKYETYVSPQKSEKDFYRFHEKENLSSAQDKYIYDMMLEQFLEGGDAYASRLEVCGESAVPPTYIDSFILDIIKNVENMYKTKILNLNDLNDNWILAALVKIQSTPYSSSVGIRPFDNLNFLQSLSADEIKQLKTEVNEYIKEFGLVTDPYDEILAKETEFRKMLLVNYFNQQKKGQRGDDLFCLEYYDTKIVSFFALTDWVIADNEDEEFSELVVRVHSSNKGGVPIVGLYKVEISYDGTFKCLDTNWCIKSIDRIN